MELAAYGKVLFTGQEQHVGSEVTVCCLKKGLLSTCVVQSNGSLSEVFGFFDSQGETV